MDISPEYHHERLRGNVICWKEMNNYNNGSFGQTAMPTSAYMFD